MNLLLEFCADARHIESLMAFSAKMARQILRTILSERWNE